MKRPIFQSLKFDVFATLILNFLIFLIMEMHLCSFENLILICSYLVKAL